MNIKTCFSCITLACILWVAWQAFKGTNELQQQQQLSRPPPHQNHEQRSASSSSSSDSAAGQTSGSGARTPDTFPTQRVQVEYEWLKQHGALVQVEVAYTGPGRGHVLLAKQALKRGDLLAAIPTDLCWVFAQHGGGESVDLAAANLVSEMADPQSFWRPFFDALPTREELACPLVNMPPEYQQLLQSPPLEEYVKGYQARVEGFWQHVVHPNAPDITLDQFKYGRSMLVTRMFGTARLGNVLVPLIHYANHVPDCPHYYVQKTCPQDPSRSCIVWMAGHYLAPGAEVCVGYKYMPNDKSLMQYGFLQDGPISHHNHLVDLPEFNSTNFWALYEDTQHGPPLFDGTVQQLQAEVSRLQGVLLTISGADNSAAAVVAAPTDSNGSLLKMMLRWREQRKMVLQEEIARLNGRIAAKSAGGAEVGDAAVAQQAPGGLQETLITWLELQGAAVQNVRIKQQPKSSGGLVSASDSEAVHLMLKPGLSAAAAVKAGELLAAVPLDLSVALASGKFLNDGLTVWQDMQHPRSPRAPYYSTLLPVGAGDVESVYKASLGYLQQCQHKTAESFLLGMQSRLTTFVQQRKRALRTRNMTADDLLHAMTLVATKYIQVPEGSFLVPLVDMARHRPDCANILTVAACHSQQPAANSSSSSNAPTTAQPSLSINTTRWCVELRAGSNLQPGDDVCIPIPRST